MKILKKKKVLKQNKQISYGDLHSIRILIAEELGLHPIFVCYAKLYRDNKLHASNFKHLEEAGNYAINKIINSGNKKKAEIIAYKYLN